MMLSIQAIARVQRILDKSVDHMPHRSHILAFGEKVVTKVLPATWKWKETILELNQVNISFRLKEVSLGNVSKIWCYSFEEYDVKSLEIIFFDALVETNIIHLENSISLESMRP